MGRQVSAIVADDLRVEVGGKFMIVGMYTAEIGIPTPNFIVRQLVFLFFLEGDVINPFKDITITMTLPGNAPQEMKIPVLFHPSSSNGRERMLLRIPVTVNDVALNPGKIIAKVSHEEGDMFAALPWIVLGPPLIQQQESHPPPS